VIEDNDEEDEEGLAPSSGQFLLPHVIWASWLSVTVLSDLRSTVAKLEPRSFHVSSATCGDTSGQLF
jgi:hypothetical protein